METREEVGRAAKRKQDSFDKLNEGWKQGNSVAVEKRKGSMVHSVKKEKE